MSAADKPEVEVALPADLTAAHAARVTARGALGRWRLATLMEPSHS